MIPHRQRDRDDRGEHPDTDQVLVDEVRAWHRSHEEAPHVGYEDPDTGGHPGQRCQSDEPEDRLLACLHPTEQE